MSKNTINTMPEMNWKEANVELLSALIAKGLAVEYVKQAITNIVYVEPRYGFFTARRTAVASKENIDGQLYECGHDDKEGNTYPRHHFVGRILGNKFLDKNGLPDTYAWTDSTLNKFLTPNTPRIGRFSPEGMANLMIIADTLETLDDKIKFSQSFVSCAIDCFLIRTPETSGIKCIEITQELFDAGLKYWPDGWRRKKGSETSFMCSTTPLEVGGLLVIQTNDDGFEEAYVVNAEAAKVYRRA